MTVLYVVRHPQTTWNVEQRYQGRLEAPLSAEGKSQSRLLASRFKRGQLDAVYSSPLRRALTVAHDLAQAAAVPLRIDQRLTEIAMGPWEGLILSEIIRGYPDLYQAWYTEPENVRFPEGESLSDVRDRALSAVRDIHAGHPDDSIAVVSHSAVIRVLAAASLSLDLRHIHSLHVHNCGITTFCGVQLAGSLMTFNSLEAVCGSPVASAKSQSCANWAPRRIGSL